MHDPESAVQDADPRRRSAGVMTTGERPELPRQAAAEADPARGRRHRRNDGKQLTVQMLSSWAELDAVRPEWQHLYRDSDGRNPYASPSWLLPWARHFVDEPDLAVVTVRRRGDLIGVAPWYRRRVGRVARGLQMLGTGRHDWLTELPQALTAADEHRSVLRAAVGHWCRRVHEWDWLDLPMGVDQGWLEPDWVTGDAEGGIIQHKGSRAAVTLAIPSEAGQVRDLLKRNLAESLNRGRNRLDKSGCAWSITVNSSTGDIRRALPFLASLHSQRAGMAGRRRHGDELNDPRRMAFLRDALTEMSADGQAQLLTLDVDGRPVAAQLVLTAPRATYIAMSGVVEDWWHVSPVTLLQMAALEEAARRGHTEFNLSIGPSVAKLRWSEHVDQHPQFIVGSPRRRAKAVFAGHRLASLAATLAADARRHRVKPRPGKKTGR